MNFKPILSCLGAALLFQTVCSEELLKNGDFNLGADWGVPAEWHFGKAGNVDVEMNKVGATLRIANRTPKTPNVYGFLHQQFKAEAGVEYTLTGQIKGSGQLLFAIGKGWKTRLIAKTDAAAAKFSYTFTLQADQLEPNGTATISIISETPTAGIELTELSVSHIAPQKAPQANLLANASFEKGPAAGRPDGWGFGASGNAEAAMRIDEADAVDGKRSLLITNASPRKPNTFAQLNQSVALQPGVAYELSGRVRGKNAELPLFAIGKGWHTRLRPSAITPDWQEFRLTFTLKPEQIEANGKAPFVIITEGLTEELRIDDLMLREEQKKIIAPIDFQKNGFWNVAPFQKPLTGLTAIPAEMPTLTIPASKLNSSTGEMPKDFSARTALAYDDKGLIVFLEAKDPTMSLEHGELMWQGDSVQIRIDQAGKSHPGSLGSDFEFGLAVDQDSKVNTWIWTSASELPADKIETAGKRTENGYFAAIRLNWDLLKEIKFPEQRYFTFTIVFNSSDKPGHRDVFFLTKGLHDIKSSAPYIRAILVDPTQPTGGVKMTETVASGAFKGDLAVTGLASGNTLTATLTDAKGDSKTVSLGKLEGVNKSDILDLNFTLPLANLAEGNISVAFTADGKRVAGFDGVNSDPVKMQSRRLTAAIERYDALKKEFDTFYGDKSHSAYASLPLAVLGDTLPTIRKQMDTATSDAARQLYVTRLEMIMPGIETSLADLDTLLAELKAGRILPETWHFRSQKVEHKSGWPYAEMVSSTGKTERRPVMFDGYGHFGSMSSYLPRFQNYGANIVQLEFGPRGIYPKQGTGKEFEADFSQFNKGILPMIENCWKNNLQLCFLISPHYAPNWWLEKYPEVQAKSGFMKYDILQPESRRMIAIYIADMVQYLKSLPNPEVFHSICLQNEPIHYADWDNPYTRKAFEAFVKQRHGSLDNFDLDAGVNDNAVKAEWIAFRKTVMNEWTALLAAEVKKAWPEIPVHSKIMISSSPFIDHGIDPEAFALSSDYNGNDNYGNYLEGGYISDWMNFALGHELQYSMKPISIMNTENHIIRDNEKRPIPNEHIYLANFFQHLTGASGLVTWVWVDFKPELEQGVVTDLRGNIALRPGNIAAHGLSQLDVNRLAPEITHFAKADAEIALLFSPSTLGIQASSYKSALSRFYSEAAFTGHRVRFLSERQLAAGEFGKVKTLFIIGAPNITQSALDGMKRFTQQGGRIVVDRFSLKKDEIDRNITVGFQPEILPDFITADMLKRDYFDKATKLPVELEKAVSGVFFRVAPGLKPGTALVFLANYSKEKAAVKLIGGTQLLDRIREEAASPALTLEPLAFRFLEVKYE